MINGSVYQENVFIFLTLRGFNDEEVVQEMVVDTGFDGFLSLPLNVIRQLNLLKSNEAYVTLADGSEIIQELYTVIVVWDGIEKAISTLASDGDLLIGMALMRGYNLSVDVEEGGQVRLSRLGGELTAAGLESGS